MRRLSKATGIAAALLAMAAGRAAVAEVTIYRGAAMQIVDTEKLTGAPIVLRGGGSMIATKSPPAPPEARGDYPRIAAGRTLWLLGKDGRLTACTLRGAGYVGRRRIVCTRR